MTVRVRLGTAELAGVRFAISPLGEAVSSLWLLYDEATANPAIRPWRHRIRAALDDADHRALCELVPEPDLCVPDYLTPPPGSARPTVDQQLTAVRGLSPNTVQDDLQRAYGTLTAPPRGYRDWPERPPGELLDAAVTGLGAYWDCALAPHWPRIRDVLEADLLYRARRLAESGLAGLFAEMRAYLRYEDGSLHINDGRAEVIDKGACSVVLVPSVFLWPHAAVGGRPGGPLVIVYPARGIGEVVAEPAPRALIAVLGEHRAHLLMDTAEPRSTEELARRHKLSPSTVSYHLTALRDAGLLARRRAGHRVLYGRTHLGNLLTWGSEVNR